MMELVQKFNSRTFSQIPKTGAAVNRFLDELEVESPCTIIDAAGLHPRISSFADQTVTCVGHHKWEHMSMRVFRNIYSSLAAPRLLLLASSDHDRLSQKLRSLLVP